MKKLIITESERRNILKSHGSIILEQSTADKLKSIQSALGVVPDAKIGPKTTTAIVSALKGDVKTGFDFTCVTNNPNKKKVAYDNEKVGYQIGELVFDKSGNYYDVKDESTKNTYTCSGTTIQTSKHGNIGQSPQIVDNTDKIKSLIKRYEDSEYSKENIVKMLSKNYKTEEILKADPTLETFFKKGSTTNSETQNQPIKTSSGEEPITDEKNIDTAIESLFKGKQQFFTGG